jgi:hypothetical protein
MMIGPKVKYCVTYKNGEKSFNVLKAAYIHNFKVSVISENLEGSKALELESLKAFLSTTKNGVNIYDSYTYQLKGALDIELLTSKEREPN